MNNIWQVRYGNRSDVFIEGVIAGIEMFAVWKNGKQVVGVMATPLKQVISEVREGLGSRENKMKRKQSREKIS